MLFHACIQESQVLFINSLINLWTLKWQERKAIILLLWWKDKAQYSWGLREPSRAWWVEMRFLTAFYHLLFHSKNVCYKHSLIFLGMTYQPPCSLEGEGKSIVVPSGQGPYYWSLRSIWLDLSLGQWSKGTAPHFCNQIPV